MARSLLVVPAPGTDLGAAALRLDSNPSLILFKISGKLHFLHFLNHNYHKVNFHVVLQPETCRSKLTGVFMEENISKNIRWSSKCPPGALESKG